MHDSCLRPWVERANSCPICRSQFTVVELRKFLDSPTFSCYAVEDRQQQAELDPAMIIAEDLLDIEEPCIMCGTIGGNEVMYCDGCDRTVHVFCAGYHESPEVWYCETCVGDLDNSANPSRLGVAHGTAQTGRARRVRARRAHVSEWDRVWQQVWRRLDLDLDFPFDHEPAEPRHTRTQRHELEAWQERLQVANRQGGANRFRDTAETLLQRRHQQPPEPPAPETREEISAWNAFDNAKRLAVNVDRPSSRRKRKSATTSPASPRDSDAAPEPERKLKRPRTRRNHLAGPEPGPSTARPVQPAEQPSFLKSLLQEVERQPAQSERNSPDGEHSGDEQHSPYFLSPASSPLHSGRVSPRAPSVTPPPQAQPRPASPTPLTSYVRPILYNMSPRFSPHSSVTNGADRARPGASQPVQPSSPTNNGSPASPSRNMSYSTKKEIQRMVKATLGPRYREQHVTKDQYTDINRDVSRLMYEKIGDAEGLADQEERDKWQQFANDEVDRAIEAMRAEEQHSEPAASTSS